MYAYLSSVVTYIAERCRLPTIQQEVQQRKLLYMGLYLLIWGEAANLRFMPECLCYIYHHVSFMTYPIYVVYEDVYLYVKDVLVGREIINSNGT